MTQMISLNEMRDRETKKTNETVAELKVEIKADLKRLSCRVDDTEIKLTSALASFDNKIIVHTDKIDVFHTRVEEVQALVEKAYHATTINTQAVSKLNAVKVDLK